MAIENLGRLAIGVDPIGFVWEKLRGYLGSLAVAKELLQNADDAFRDDRGPVYVEFDFTSESLIVTHIGKPFDKRDFESITLIASGSKRADAERTGTFGVGFVSVYHVTDRPTVESNGWRISWNVADREAIPVRVASSDRTRFEFPWRAERTDFSDRIGAETWSPARRSAFLHDLGRRLPGLLLFLRYVTEIAVLRDGKRLYSAVKTRQRPHGARGSFEVDIAWEGPRERREERWLCMSEGVRNTELATLMKPKVGEEADLCLGFRLAPPPDADFDGLIYNLLPTTVSTGFPFHIESQFFPNSERTSIIVCEGEPTSWPDEAKWNARLIEATGALLVEAVEQLKETLGGRERGLYAYLPTREARFPFVSQVRTRCLEAASGRSWIWTAGGVWRTAGASYRVEPNLRRVLEGEDVSFADARVQQRYERLLTTIGVPDFGPSELYQLLRPRVLESSPLSQAPECLNELGKLRALYRFLADRVDEVEPAWANLPVWFSEGETLESANRLWLPDEEFRQLFESSRDRFVHQTVEMPGDLAEKLGIRRVDRQHVEPIVDFLELLDLEPMPMVEAAPPFNGFRTLQKAYRLLGRALSDAAPAQRVGLAERLRRLPIYANQGAVLRPVDGADVRLTLPPREPLDVPLELESVLHPEALKNSRSFFEDVLRVETLTLDSYVRDYLAREYARDYLSADEKFAVLEWVRRIHPQLNEAAWDVLKATPLVECADGRFRRGTEVYFRNQTLDELIGDYSVPSRRYRGEPWRDFLSRVGVASVPRERDLVRTVEAIASGAVNDPAIRQIRAVFHYVDATFFRKAGGKPPAELQRLAEMAWLPAKGDSSIWHRGRDLYAIDAEPLVGPHKKLLRFQRPSGEFSKFLGLREPTVEDMVQCLIWSSEAKQPVNRQIYERLNAALVKDRARIQPQLAPLIGRAVIYQNGRYWNAQQAFFADYRREFGKYRTYVGKTTALVLFQAIGVTDDLKPSRYAKFLLDLAEWKRGEVLSEQDCRLVENAYLHLAEADEADLARLRGDEVVLDVTGQLVGPDSVFLLDRPALVKKFGDAAIPCPMTRHAVALRVLERVGVARLSTIVTVVPIELDEGPENGALASRIRLLVPAFRRIRDTLAKKLEDGWRPPESWPSLRVHSSGRIRLYYRFPLDGGWVESQAHDEQAYLDEAAGTLYVVARAEPVALANALAQWLNPEVDSAQLSPILALLLSRAPGDEKELLDSLGFDDLGLDLPLPDAIHTAEELKEEEGEEEAAEEVGEEDGEEERAAGGGPARPGRPGAAEPGRKAPSPVPERPGTFEGKDRGGAGRGGAVEPIIAREFRFSISYPAPGGSREGGGGTGENLIAKGVEGVRWAMRYEELEERQPRDVSAENLGYDVESQGLSGHRLIEVKLRSSPGTGVLDVNLTPNEAAAALRHRENYYVYVVEKCQGSADEVVVHEVRLEPSLIRWAGVSSASRRLSADPGPARPRELTETRELFRAAVRQLADGVSNAIVLTEAARLFVVLAGELSSHEVQNLAGSLESQTRRVSELKQAVSGALDRELCAAWQTREVERVERLLDVLERWDRDASGRCPVSRQDVSNYRAFLGCRDAWERYGMAGHLPFLTTMEWESVRRSVWETARPRLEEFLAQSELDAAAELFRRLTAVMTDPAELRPCASRLAQLFERAGETALQAGQSVEAIPRLEAAIATHRWLPGRTGRDRLRVAIVFEGLAEAYAASGRSSEAVLAYEFLRMAAEDHDEIRDIVEPLARLYSKMRLPDRAADLLDEFPGEYDDVRAECVEDKAVDANAHREWKDFLQKARGVERYTRLGLAQVVETLLVAEEFWEAAREG